MQGSVILHNISLSFEPNVCKVLISLHFNVNDIFIVYDYLEPHKNQDASLGRQQSNFI